MAGKISYYSCMQLISCIYECALCLLLWSGSVVLSWNRPDYPPIQRNLWVSTALIFIAILLTISIVGEIKKLHLLMLPMLFVQFCLLVASTFIGLFYIVHTVYYFVWTQINEDSAKNDWHFVTNGTKHVIVLGLFILVNTFFGFWLPIQRFMFIQHDKKNSKEKTASKTFV